MFGGNYPGQSYLGQGYAGATGGGGSQSGAAAMSAQAGMGVGGAVTETPAVAMSTRAGMGVTPAVTETPAVPMSARAGMGVTGTDSPLNAGVVAMSAQAGITVRGATGAIIHMSAQAGITAAATHVELGTLTLAAQAGLTVAGTATGDINVPMSALAGMAATVPLSITFTLPGPDLTLTAGPVTHSGTVTFVLGTKATLDAPGNTGAEMWWTPADRPALVLYDTDGQTYLTHLTLARNVKFQHELSAAGSLSWDLPTDDDRTAMCTSKRVVKCWYRGRPRIAARLDDSSTETAVEGRAWRSWQLPGALSWLGEIATYPEYGIGSKTSSVTRTFGIGSKTGHWYYATGDWSRAQGFPYRSDTGLKSGKPKGLYGPDPWWIAKVDPYAHAAANSVQYFRRVFTLASGVTAQIACTGDDLLTLWLDGEEIFTPDQQSAQSWQYLATITVALDAGEHVLAAKVQNSSVDSAGNPIAFILAMQQTNTKGDPVKGSPLLISDSWWMVSGTMPGWNRAGVIHTLHDEGLARGVKAAELLDLGFGTVTDSNSQNWTDVGELTVDIGGSLLDVGQAFAETHLDLDVVPGPLNVNAYIRKGTDLSGSVTLNLGSANGSLMQHTVQRAEPTSNAAIMQLRDGRWVERTDASSITGFGRAEIGLSLGSTSEDDTADEVADKQFNETARETLSFTTQLTVLDGPQPYVDFNLGDSVMVPDDQGGHVKARVMAITVDGSGESVQQYVEPVQDPT